MTHDVFISYSRVDVKIADNICRLLDEAGISYWIDRGGITSGEAFPATIVRAVKDGKITIFLSSASSNKSIYTIKEVTIAFKNKKHIIPVCIDSEPFADKLELFLCDLDFVDYYSERESAIKKLINDLSILLNKKIEKDSKKSEVQQNQIKEEKKTSLCYLKIRPNLACYVWIDGKEIVRAEANQITKLPLNSGSFWLEFISEDDKQDKYSCEYILLNSEQLLSVDLQKVASKRIEQEKLELVTFKNLEKYGFKEKTTGKVIIPSKYDYANEPFRDGLTYVRLDGKYGFIDKSGKEVIPLKYDNASVFSEGLSYVDLNGKTGFIDRAGKTVIPFQYDDVTSFCEGLAGVKSNGKWGFINKSGDMVVSQLYEIVSPFCEGLSCVVRNGQSCFINKSGRVIIPFKYDRVFPFSEGLACVELNGKRGFIDKTGKEVIPLKYDTDCHKWGTYFYKGYICVKLNDDEFYLDKSGNRV